MPCITTLLVNGMKRNSNTLFLESLNAITPVLWVNNAPDFTRFTEPTLSILESAWQAFLSSGDDLEVVPDPIPATPDPDWDQLLRQLLSGELYPIYARLTAASFVNPATATLQEISNVNNIAFAATKLDQAVQVTKNEDAVAAAINLLLTGSNYSFTAEEKTLWNTIITNLGFSAVMQLQ